jgi:hypothetical protein
VLNRLKAVTATWAGDPAMISYPGLTWSSHQRDDQTMYRKGGSDGQ